MMLQYSKQAAILLVMDVSSHLIYKELVILRPLMDGSLVIQLSMFIQSVGIPMWQVNRVKDVLILQNIVLVSYCVLTMSKHCFSSILMLEYFSKCAVELINTKCTFVEQVYLWHLFTNIRKFTVIIGGEDVMVSYLLFSLL